MEESESQVAYICKGPKVEGGGRIACGHDVTLLVRSSPADGEDRVVECPRCGTQTKVTRMPPDEP